MSGADSILAGDCGGTRCRLALVANGQRHLVETGSANASTDLMGAVSEIRAGLDRLRAAAQLPKDTFYATPAYLGVAGAVSSEITKALSAQLPLSTVRIEDDRSAAVRGALGNGDGALIHCGTGSFLALQMEGRIRLAGGWGPHVGDEGSSQWIGRKALSATLKAQDGTGDRSALTDTIMNHFGSASEIVKFAGSANPAQFGEMAKLVTERSSKSDVIAQRILSSGLAKMVDQITRLGWTARIPLCLTGGLGPAYEPYLEGPLRDALHRPKATPLEGAIDLARAFREESFG